MPDDIRKFAVGLLFGICLGAPLVVGFVNPCPASSGALPLNMHAGSGKIACDRHCRRLRRKRRVVRPWNAKLNRIAWCESSGRWHLNSGNGFYGGLQFTLGTWRSAGGAGYPHRNSKLEQKYRAVRWHNKIGTWVSTAGWPVCGYR